MKNISRKKFLMPLNIQFFAEGEGGGDDGAGGNSSDNNGDDKNKSNDGNTTKDKDNSIDVMETKKAGVIDFLKSLGVDTEEDLKGIVTKHKEEEAKNMTDLEKVKKERDDAIKTCSEERRARIQAEAQLEALKLGAKKELVENLVIIAQSKVTKDKDIKKVMEEIKAGDTGSVYFGEDTTDEGEGGKGKHKQKKMVTRKGEGEDKDNNNGDDGSENNHDGSIAQRLLSGRKTQKKSAYW